MRRIVALFPSHISPPVCRAFTKKRKKDNVKNILSENIKTVYTHENGNNIPKATKDELPEMQTQEGVKYFVVTRIPHARYRIHG